MTFFVCVPLLAFLQEADAVYRLHEEYGENFSWINFNQQLQEDPQCQELWNKLQVLLALKEEENGNI